jgi:biopolymer transport protein ExbD
VSLHANQRGARRLRRARGSAVDLTPLIDVTFQLLLFFVITATFQDQSSLQVELARAKNQERATEQKAVVVSIDAEGRLEIDKKLVDERELEMRLCKEAEAGKLALHIRADKDSRNEVLVFTMDVAKRCGLRQLGILHVQP